jgi:hypothetical protein
MWKETYWSATIGSRAGVSCWRSAQVRKLGGQRAFAGDNSTLSSGRLLESAKSRLLKLLSQSCTNATRGDRVSRA